MLAEDFSMDNYPIREDGKDLDGKVVSLPATKYWRLSYLDKDGRDKFYNHTTASPVCRIPEKDIPTIEKNMKAARIISVRFGCMWFQEEVEGEWKELQLAKEAPATSHYYEGPDALYTQLYFKVWRPEAYMYVKDVFKYKAPSGKDDNGRSAMLRSTIDSQAKEIENLKRMLNEQKNAIQNKAVIQNQAVDGAVASMIQQAKAGAKAQGMV